MDLTIHELKQKWKKEKKAYKSQEVGTGVQSFVKDVLECEELFNLKEGKLSTKLLQRRKEFIHEKRTKEQRSADFVIFISPEIVIPVEAEVYGDIKSGVEQLFRYQKDLDRKYGILTDGYTWRFYNNNIFKTFILDELLSNPALFRDFWDEYTKPEYYYLSFFEELGQLRIFKDIEKLYVEQNKIIFFEDITNLIRSFKNKLNIEGYFEELEKSEREKKSVEITYAYIIQFILYKTLVDNDYDEYGENYEKKVKAIHKNIKSKSFKAILGIIDGISAEISENIYRPFVKEQEFIGHKLRELYRSVENKLADVSPWLDIFVFIKKYNFANVKNDIFGYIYENYLKELYEDEQRGQYFTDPAIVNFMLQQIGYTGEKLRDRIVDDKDKISLIDPACGSGTFLYSAVDAIINAVAKTTEQASKKIEEIIDNNIFGLDISEFPLYLAEMSILMRMLPLIITEKYNNPIDKKIKVFKTVDSISEFLDTAIRNTISDLDVAFEKAKGTSEQVPLFAKELDLGYKSYVRDEDDLKEMKRSLENKPLTPRFRFDYIIGNPPYVGYNECSKQGVNIFKLLKKKDVKLSNIYGVNLHSISGAVKKRPPKPNLYAFFIVLGFSLLKDGGKLCYIVPQTLLTSGDHDTIRYHLAKFTTIEKIITFNNPMFIGRGLKQKSKVATSSMVFVVERRKPSITHQVKIVKYENPDDEIETIVNNIKSDKNLKKYEILQGKLLQNASNWNFIKQEKRAVNLYENFKDKSIDMSVYYNHTRAEYTFKNRFYFDIGYNIDERNVVESPKNDSFVYRYPKLNKKFWSIKEYKGFWPDIRGGGSKYKINLLKANQGYNLLESKHKVLWSYANPDKFYYSSEPLIWARNQICAIGSADKNEIFFLFAILNSTVVNYVLNIFLRSEAEKNYLVPLDAAKKYVRIPKVNQANLYIKNEIISNVDEMIKSENIILSDLVNFSGVMVQKLDAIGVEGNNLVLVKDNHKIKCKIQKQPDLVKKVIKQLLADEKLIKDGKISLSELKSLPVIDYEKQRALKGYIDDLVFALYFNVPLGKIGLQRAKAIKAKSAKNRFYKLLSKHSANS